MPVGPRVPSRAVARTCLLLCAALALLASCAGNGDSDADAESEGPVDDSTPAAPEEAFFREMSLRGGFGGGADSEGGEGGTDQQAQDLPWLIQLDEFVDDQAHLGTTDFVIRSNGTETALNEVMSLELLELAGLPTQDWTYLSLSANQSEPSLRLAIENPNDEWDAERFDDDGILYKAESGGDYSYRGDDPDAYDEVFDQETQKDDEDLTPLMELLEFIDESDDETFAAELEDHLEVEELATYLAIEELLQNFDDIDGPGQQLLPAVERADRTVHRRRLGPRPRAGRRLRQRGLPRR
jgi:hypothetical protein